MNIILPPASTSLSIILDTIKRSLIPAISQNEAANRLLLTSPNGTVYTVTVDNSGNIVTEVTDGKTRP